MWVLIFSTTFAETSLKLISVTKLMHKFFYSITICMLHYNPRHVSSINMPIFRRTNFIITASGIVTLCKWLYSMLDESSHVEDCSVTYILLTKKRNCALKLVNEISLYYDARSGKHQTKNIV